MLDLLKFSITADNRTAAAFGKLKGDLRGVKGALVGVDDYAKRAGRAMRNIGLGMSAAITAPLALAGRQALGLYDEQIKAEASVRQAIVATGGAAGKSADELFRMASGMQKFSLFGDEDILKKVTSQLLLFKNISGETFDQAQQSVLDFATQTNKDLGTVALALGKALDAPARGLDALSRVGVTFSNTQKETIRSLVAMGDVAAAQSVILGELAGRSAGQAAAAALVGLGPLTQLRMAIGDLKEDLGEQIVTFLPDVLKSVRAGVVWFGQLSPEVKKNVVLFGGLAAAAGPVVLLFGTFTLGVAGLAGGLTGLANVMGGVTVAAGRMAIALAVAAGPWGILAGLVAGAAGYMLLFKGNTQGVKTPLEEAKAAQMALNGAMGMFYDTAAPSAGQAAVETANKYYQYANAAREAARANIAVLQSELSAQVAMNNGLAFGNFFGKDQVRNIEADLTVARAELAAATRSLEDAERRRKATVTAITGAMSNQMTVIRGLNSDINVTVDGVSNLGGGMAAATGSANGLSNALVKVGAQAPDIDRMFGATFSGIIRGADNARDALGRLLDRLADQALSNLFSNLFGNIGLGKVLGGILGFQSGGVFGGGRQVAFANGGVVSGPTTFPMAGGSTGLMGEAGPEAIMPLSRGSDGRLGVRLQGGGGGVTNIHVSQVINAPGADAGAVTRIEQAMARAKAELPSQIVQTVIRAQKSRILT